MQSVMVQDDPRAHLLGWLTVERAAYAAAAILALGLRLWGVGSAPLGPGEAAQALPALAGSAGQAPDLASASPLLYSLQRTVFMLFGAGEGAARWWPALLGGLSPLLFFFLRGWLGRGGAMAAAALWAFSPLAVWSGRLGVGDAQVPPLALALLAALAWAAQERHQSEAPGPARLYVPACAAAALLLSAGRGAYTALLAGGLAFLLWPTAARRLWEGLVHTRRAALAAFAGVLVLGSTFLALTPSGLAAVASLLGAWLRGLLPGPGEYSTWEILRRLLISELPLLCFGVAGLIRSWRRGDRFGLWAGAAAGLSLLLPLIGRGRHPVDLALTALALVLLAGPAVARTLAAAWSARSDLDPWLLFVLSLVLAVSASIGLPSAFESSNSLPWRQIYAGVGIAAAAVFALTWVVYGAWGSWQVVGRTLPVVLLVLGLAWSVSQAAGLSYDRGAGRQAGILHVVSAPETVDFRAALERSSELRGGGARETAVDLVWPDRPGDEMVAVLRWQLRAYPALRILKTVPSDPSPLVITLPEDQPRLNQSYAGAEFALLQRWEPTDLGDFNAHLRWLLLRETSTVPDKSRVILWVSQLLK